MKEVHIRSVDDAAPTHVELLDRVFFALSDPVRRAILERLDGESLLVSELVPLHSGFDRLLVV